MQPSGPTLESRSASASTKRRVLLAAIFGAGLVFLDTSVATISLPAIQREFGISTSMQQWVASSYLLTLSVLLLVGGRLADLFGRKRLFVVGLASYALLSSAAAVSPNGYWLVAARALQGVAGAMLVPTTLALINANFPSSERGKAIGTWAAWSGVTTILGPIVGGFAIDNLSWRFAFLLSPTLAVGALVLSRGVPESRDQKAARGIDVLGVLLVVGSFGGITFALIQGPIVGWGDPAVLAGGIAGLALLPVFLLWEAKARSPVMPYGLFANRNLAVANVVTFFVYAGLYGMFFYVPIYAQSALGASATIAGGMFVPITLLLLLLSPYAGRLNDAYGPRWLMCGGPLTAAAGLVVAATAGQGQLWTVLVPGLVLFGVGLGFTVAPVTATAIGSAEERYSGVASGFNNGISRLAGLLAIAVMGAIVVQLWQGALEAVSAESSPAVARSLELVSDRAFVTPDAEGLTAEEAQAASRAASEAASDAFRNGMLLAAALVALGGVVSAVWIRSPEPASDESVESA